MNRIIKFRVYDTHLKTYTENAHFYHEFIKWLGDDRYICEQFTGLTDKNSKEIYCGDIVRHNDYTNGACLTFKQYQRVSVIECSDLFNGIKLKGLGTSIDNRQLEAMEIIGNININPELLK